jgi:hypothetical protein
VVDLAEIQIVYYMVAATGVLVAAVFYIFNLRYTLKAKEMETCRFITDRMTSDLAMQAYGILMQKDVEWNDHDEFMGKYGYDNPEFFGHWTSWFFVGETLGYMIKNKIVRAETIYDLGAWGFIRIWEKYGGFILSRREAATAWGRDYFIGFEFLAKEMVRIKTMRDASFQGKLDAYRTTWKP